MIPANGTISGAATEAAQQPSRTYRLDIPKGRIAGMTDGLNAVKQAVFKILQSERFRYAIYSSDYGHELNSLIGGSPEYVRSEVSRLIQEALLQDDRIIGIQNLQVAAVGDNLAATFTVVSDFGSFEQEVETGV